MVARPVRYGPVRQKTNFSTQAEGAARFVSSALAYRTERVSYQMSDILYRKQPFFLYIEN